MEGLNFNIFNILIIIGIIQGIIFSIIVLFNPKYASKTNLFLVLTALVLSFSNFQYWINDIGLPSVFDKLRIPSDTLIVPFFYLFVEHYLKNKIFKKNICLLLTPFILSLSINLFTYFNSLGNQNIPLNIGLEVFSFTINIFLIVLIVYKLKKYKKDNLQYNKEKVVANTKWLMQILYIGFFMCLFWFVTIIVMSVKFTGLHIYYPLWLSISILIYWISYVGIINSKINDDRTAIRPIIITHSNVSSINLNKQNDLFETIKSSIEDEKLYLNPELKLKNISKSFNKSIGYISQLFSSQSNYNFNDYINRLRIQEAISMLNNKDYNNYTIESIGLECGFNSKSSFYGAFKKFTGKTPAIYKKEVLNL